MYKLVVEMLKFIAVFILCVQVHNANGLAVMSVDIGTEWMKVAIVSPGVPMEIALNRESQRKTAVAVAFRDSERTFGDPALSIGVRFPEKCYSYILSLVGKKIDNPLVELYKERFPYYKIVPSSDRDSVLFEHPDGYIFSPEELIAMILKQAQEIAKNAAGQPIKDAVITVPPYFSQAERRALLQAAEMSGVNVLQLINSNTAVALNYGVFRRRDFNETPTNILFYDMGAGSTVATVVSYQLVKSKETGEVNPQLTIKGVGFDRTLGGLEMQLRLRDYFAKAFNNENKAKTDVFKNNRAMAKLLKEAGRVKKVLSANADHIAQVESLLEDIDFRCPISRVEFESLSSDLFDRVIEPAAVALKAANMELDHIDQVILSGSGVRVPKVQQILLDFVKKPELGKSINTDEAAALGAAYQAAHLSKGFKVKTFLIRDANIYPIQVDFQREYELEDKSPAVKSIRRTLFTRNNVIPQRKVMTFNRHDKDFSFSINYGELNFLNDFEYRSIGSLNITKVSLKGVESTLQKNLGENIEYKGVKAHFTMDESGILHVEQIESVFEKTVEEEEPLPSNLESTLAKLGNTIGRLFSGSDTAADTAKTDDADKAEEKTQTENTTAKEQDKQPQKDANAVNDTKTENAAKNVSSTKKEPKVIVIKEPIVTEKLSLDLAEFSESQAQQSIKKLRDLDEHDRAKLAKEKAKNSLESFIVETKDKLYHEDYEKASTDEERENIKKSLTEIADWLEYESDNAATEVFQNKLSQLRKLTRDLFERVKEHRERPEAIKALKEMLNLSEIFLNGARNMSEDEQIFTDVELKTLGTLIADTKKWQVESEVEQASLVMHVQPKLTVKLISEKIANLDREVKYLLNKARFATPLKKKKTEKATKNDTEQNATAAEESGGKNKDEAKPVDANDKTDDATADDEIKENETVTPEPFNVPDSNDEASSEPGTSTERPSPDPVESDDHSEL